MTFDQLEAIRLVDAEGLYQGDAAHQMHVSRQTFSNIIAAARHKVASMLVDGKQLTITGGNTVVSSEERVFSCTDCRHQWSTPYGIRRPGICPSCGSENLHRTMPEGSVRGNRQPGAECRRHRESSDHQANGYGIYCNRRTRAGQTRKGNHHLSATGKEQQQ